VGIFYKGIIGIEHYSIYPAGYLVWDKLVMGISYAGFEVMIEACIIVRSLWHYSLLYRCNFNGKIILVEVGGEIIVIVDKGGIEKQLVIELWFQRNVAVLLPQGMSALKVL